MRSKWAWVTVQSFAKSQRNPPKASMPRFQPQFFGKNTPPVVVSEGDEVLYYRALLGIASMVHSGKYLCVNIISLCCDMLLIGFWYSLPTCCLIGSMHLSHSAAIE